MMPQTDPTPPPDRWRWIQQLLDGALDLPAEQRERFLRQACGADTALRDEVSCLLARTSTSRTGEGLLDLPAAAFAGPVLAELAAYDTERRAAMVAVLNQALAGRYSVAGPLQDGGMASVLRGQDLRHERAVAIKVVDRDLVAPAGVNRFLQEIRVTAQLAHPHILPVYDSGEADGLLYYTMPYVEGETLRARLLQGGAPPLEEAIRLLGELADALTFAHQRGVVHCDLKPENILLSGGHAVVADFGIARAVAAAQSGDRRGLTGEPALFGTPAYMAPEQADPGARVDHRADLFALGVIAYELVSGIHPFGLGGALVQAEGQATAGPVPLDTLKPGMPAGLSALVASLLAPDPAGRPESATEVLRQLRAAGMDTARVEGPSGRVRPRRRRSVILASSLVLLSAGLLVKWPGGDGAKAQRPPVVNESEDSVEGLTSDPEAVRLFRLARTYRDRPGFQRSNLESAVQLYEAAVARDPGFALAHAELSEVHGSMYWQGFDPGLARLGAQRKEAEEALRLEPDLFEAHQAMGMVYYNLRDFQRTLGIFTALVAKRPNDPQIVRRVAATHRRLGHWDEAIDAFRRAAELEPQSVDALADLGNTLTVLRRYDEAAETYDRAHFLAPDHYTAALSKAFLFTRWQGLDSLRAVLDRLPAGVAQEVDCPGVRSLWGLLLHWERNADSLLALTSGQPLAGFTWQSCMVTPGFYNAWAHQMRGEAAAARAAFQDALNYLDSIRPTVPDEWRVHATRGMALAGLGRREEARREADWLSGVGDKYVQAIFAGPYRAQILAQAGYLDEAIDVVELLLAQPSRLTAFVLEHDPLWDPLRDHPRFKELLARYR